MPQKDTYVLELRNGDGKVTHRSVTKAYTRSQAWRNFKIRANDEGWDYLLALDNTNIDIFIDPGVPQKGPKDQSWAPSAKKPIKNLLDWETCPKCRKNVEDDYCQSCGWQRYSQWYSKMKRESSIIDRP